MGVGLGRGWVSTLDLGVRQNLSEEEYFELRQGKKPPPSFRGDSRHRGPESGMTLDLSKHPKVIDGANLKVLANPLREDSFKLPYFQNHFSWSSMRMMVC